MVKVLFQQEDEFFKTLEQERGGEEYKIITKSNYNPVEMSTIYQNTFASPFTNKLNLNEVFY